jgi:hypothetical protein
VSAARPRVRVLRAAVAAAVLVLPMLHARHGGPAVHAAQASAVDIGVRDVLKRYADALESLDARAVKKIHPSVSEESLARAFREMRALKVVIDQIRVLSSDAALVRVSCAVTQTLTPKAGSEQKTSITRVVRLRRDADTWVVDNFER